MSNCILSKTAAELIPSGIRKISDKVNERIEKGERIFNLTVGDFSPKVFPIPQGLKDEIKKAYDEDLTNYPPSNGVLVLRQAISKYIKERGGFDYGTDEIVIGSGARPLSYTFFKAVVNPGEKIIYPAPSWNNNCYVQLIDAVPVPVLTKFENNFVATAEEIKPHIKDAALIAMNSPLNPSGTVYTREALKEILDLIVEENKRREKINAKPLYIFYDMIYWILVYGETKHVNPLELNPAIRDYTVFIDGISKCMAATGVRLGWAFGPKPLIAKISAMLAHIGAWSPRPEQTATGRFLNKTEEVDRYFEHFKKELFGRMNIFYDGIMEIKKSGYDVDAIYPQAAMYLTVKLNLIGKKTEDGKTLKDVDDVLAYILEEGKIALVPFYAFGADPKSPWFRLSVGTCGMEEAKAAVIMLKDTIEKLK